MIYSILCDEENESTLEELGKKLNLSKNTVWSFNQRVKEKRKTVKNMKSKEELWQKIIY